MKIDFEHLIRSILLPYPSHKVLHNYVNVCHKIAITYLKLKIKRNQLNLSFFDLPIEDLAIDVIAPLFKIDDNGYLCDVKRFYENHNYSVITDSDEYLILTRQLIFGAVKQNLFKLYDYYDHELSKIIRNIKLELKKHPFLCSQAIHGQTCITIQNGNNSLSSANFPIELFETELTRRVRDNVNIPQIIELVYSIFLENSEKEPAINLTIAAMAIRNCISNGDIFENNEKQNLFSFDEKEAFLNTSLNMVKDQIGAKYILSRKLNQFEVDQMFSAAAEILRNLYMNDESEEQNYFDVLHRVNPSITREVYSEWYRTKLEYIIKLVREDFLTKIKNEF